MPFHVKFCFVFVNSSSKFAYLLILKAQLSGNNIIYLEKVTCISRKFVVCTQLLNILRLEIFNSFGLLTASMCSTIKQLNKILTLTINCLF